jgi:tetratricopeptide (TPR) repeat protein
MSPEQLATAAPVDYRCDFFALGAVLYQMATGARPFDIQPRNALSLAIQIQPHMPIRRLAPHHPVQLERIIDRLLAKQPADRFQTAAALRAELDALGRVKSATPGVPAWTGSASMTAPPFDAAGPDDPTTCAFRDGLAADLSRRLTHLAQPTEDAIAREVSHAIAAALSRTPARRYSQDPEAYHAFKRGQHQWTSCFEGGWRPAIEHFRHAIDLDPQFALAHVALANAYNFLGFYALVKPSLAFAVARRSAERALAINPALGPAFIEFALARFGGEWDWDGAEQAFRQGLALDSANPLAHVYYSWLLMLLGREDAALTEAARGHALAPASRLMAGARAQTMYLGHRYDEAIELCDDCLRFDPQYVFAVHLRGLCYLAKSIRDEAVADLEQAVALSRRAPFYMGLLGRCYGEFGMREQALSLVDELRRQPDETYVPPQCYVFIYAGLGERERALEYQEKAYEDGASPFNYLTPCIRALYALSPDHKKRLEQMRLVV